MSLSINRREGSDMRQAYGPAPVKSLGLINEVVVAGWGWGAALSKGVT